MPSLHQHWQQASHTNPQGSVVPSPYRWYIFTWKFICGIRYQQASFTDSTVSNDHTFYGLHDARFFALQLQSKNSRTSFPSLMERLLLPLGWQIDKETHY